MIKIYISENLYQPVVKFIDVPDVDFFKLSLQAAIKQFETRGEINENLDKFKRRHTPVIYASTVTKKRKEDDIMTRKSLNQRAKRRFIMIDVDLESGDIKTYNRLRKNLIDLSENLNTYLVIYPTVSYPEKPRFRAVLFTERLLDKKGYYQAVHWLYDEIDSPILDKGDLYMSNNNAPLFTNNEQVDEIYSNLDDPDRTPLDNKLWKSYRKPKTKDDTPVDDVPTDLDEIELVEDVMTQLGDLIVEKERYTDYQDFWKFVHTLIRAEHFGQITEQQVVDVLERIADVSKDIITREKWKKDNVDFYMSERERLNETDIMLSKPLLRLEEMQILMSQNKSIIETDGE